MDPSSPPSTSGFAGLLPADTIRALARAVGLRLPAPPADGVLPGGTSLQLQVSPSATASQRIVEASRPMGAAATALGLGVGNSRFLADPEAAAFFNSPSFTLLTGGGSVAGSAKAEASATGRNEAAVQARAVNIALANIGLLSTTGQVLRIGSNASPFSATATAQSRSLLPASAQPTVPASLEASATVRGLEGRAPDGSGPAPLFQGQPDAVVAALAALDLDPGASLTGGSARADARGIEGYRVLAQPSANPALIPAVVRGEATARLALRTGAPTAASPVALAATAVGIDASSLFGPARGAVSVVGRGLAGLEPGTPPPSGSYSLEALEGIGIRASTVVTGEGDDLVMGEGGVDTAALSAAGTLSSAAIRAAGIDGSTISTGGGGDVVVGVVRDPRGFDGIRRSSVSTGSGDDAVSGTASESSIATDDGDDRISLKRSRDSNLSGGNGDDRIVIDAEALRNRLDGGFGNDLLSLGSGEGNRLDGGYGRDVMRLGSSEGDTVVQSSAGAALDGVSSAEGGNWDLAELLADPGFWSTLTPTEATAIWSSGVAARGGTTLGSVELVDGFDPARGSILELSSSLGSITQQLWESEGALFDVKNGALLVRPGQGSPGSQLGLVVGTLQDIRSLGIGSPSLAYATDTHQLLFDADGNWLSGSRSIATLNISDPAALQKGNVRFNA